MKRDLKREEELRKNFKQFVFDLADYYEIDRETDIRNSGDRICDMLFDELTCGYYQNPDKYLKFFDAQFQPTPLVIEDIPVRSLCEHHFLPFYGKAKIVVKYKEGAKVLGLSKFFRIVDNFSRKFQLQERLTNEIADYLQTHLDIEGCIVEINCQHDCVKVRGVNSESGNTKTVCARGCYKDTLQI